MFGRLAQGESAAFTRQRSLVRTQYRPPYMTQVGCPAAPTCFYVIDNVYVPPSVRGTTKMGLSPLILQIDKLTKSFGARTLFADVCLRIEEHDRYALVGPNGAGKTTMMNIIAGREPADSGQVIFAKGAQPGYLEQESIEMLGRTVLEEVMSGFADIMAAEERLTKLEHRISNTDDEAEQERLLEEYGRLQSSFEASGGYGIESQARAILFGLGFHEEDLLVDAGAYSGGWQMRIALAKLLLRKPDILLLDEPTNHLDLESVRWLEGFLRSYDGAVFVVSHDRAFIDSMVDHVCEIDGGHVNIYTGGYTDYLHEREERLELLRAQAEAQAKEIEHMEAFVERFRYKATKAKQVQDRVKKLERIERIEVPEEKKAVHFRFPQPPRTGQNVLHMEGISKAYGDNVVYTGLDLDLWRGEKIALVGPNGAGKSTLLKMIAGAMPPDSGNIRLGAHVDISYFAQHQLEALNLDETVFQELDDAAPGWRSRRCAASLAPSCSMVTMLPNALASSPVARSAASPLPRCSCSQVPCCVWTNLPTIWT